MKQENIERFKRLERENTQLAEGLLQANRELVKARELADVYFKDLERLQGHVVNCAELMRRKSMFSHRVDL